MSTYEILVFGTKTTDRDILHTFTCKLLFSFSVFFVVVLLFVSVHDLQFVTFRENGSQNLEHRLSPFLFFGEKSGQDKAFIFG